MSWSETSKVLITVKHKKDMFGNTDSTISFEVGQKINFRGVTGIIKEIRV